jgi:hypothetical protein
MPTDVLKEYGLTKTLLTRRETIYLKHILKNIFIYENEENINTMLKDLNYKSLFQYIAFLTNKLRCIYKLPREYNISNADNIVKQRRESFFKTLEVYKDLKPIVIIDFDRTITNKKFHDLYNYLTENKYRIVINSANPSIDTIKNYLTKYNMIHPKNIYANKGKLKKIIRLKEIAISNQNKIIFYIDDEIEYLNYGVLLTMYCYRYTTRGKIYNYTIFKK